MTRTYTETNAVEQCPYCYKDIATCPHERCMECGMLVSYETLVYRDKGPVCVDCDSMDS